MDDFPKDIQDILSKPTASIIEAARVLGFGKNAAYEAAIRGDIKTIDIGSRKRVVSTAWLKRKLDLEA